MKDKSAFWIATTTAGGMLSPMMGKVPLVSGGGGEVLNEIGTGYFQAIMDMIEDQE